MAQGSTGRLQIERYVFSILFQSQKDVSYDLSCSLLLITHLYLLLQFIYNCRGSRPSMQGQCRATSIANPVLLFCTRPACSPPRAGMPCVEEPASKLDPSVEACGCACGVQFSVLKFRVLATILHFSVETARTVWPNFVDVFDIR
jgi:hypothetical protein